LHIPDGFINAGVSAAAGAASAAGVGVSLVKAKATMDEKQAPLAGLVAAYVFAVQMLNFPVAAGTSGHLLGGVLAAVLVGPWAGCIVIALVLMVQALMFSDGGMSALGLNVLNMAIIGTWGGYLVFLVIRWILPRNRPSLVAAASLAAFTSVILAAMGFVVEYALGGAGDAPIGTVLAAMGGVHLLIGVGEAVITGLTISAVVAVRPDVVYGAKDLMPALEIHSPSVKGGEPS